MSKAIEDISRNEEFQRLMRLADFQDWFIRRYSGLIEDENLRDCFRRELIYLIHLAYREAQEPLVKQLTDFVVTNSRPLIMELGGGK